MPVLCHLFPNPLNPNLTDERLWFQQDGAPPHYAAIVRQYLDRIFPEQLPVLLENVPLQLLSNMCFHHNGAPPHKARIVQQYLNETYGENWIGINGPIPWAPKSPDLTPLDFFLWGTLKNKVYRTLSVNLEHLKQKIRNACDELSGEMLRKASVREGGQRLDKCLEVGGGHIENLL
ncbi:hypothetical protein NQ318_014188 [Aromia moschata]|uniref:Uncharacterized protein n=1 Tax=Aromia moschata TaxID=1265417 RepID=A0AAV8Y7E5_9CUCU|nr:hypothetical protein NQ318_014188 [Aromia moschata]